MIKQNKGKDLSKIAPSKLDSKGPYYVSKKYDGHYTQIKYDGKDVQFFTSGGKPFHLELMAEYIRSEFSLPFHIECEYLRGCDGRLGSRGKSAKLTTYRTEYLRGKSSRGDKQQDIFVVLDLVNADHMMFKERLDIIRELFTYSEWFMVPEHILTDLNEGINLSQKIYRDGYEGVMLKHSNHIYQSGKRTNDIIKIKPRQTADLLCIGFRDGEGKYEGMIGSLILKDIKGRQVQVGSGLSDFRRGLSPEYFIGQVVEIEYERIDTTYIQPTYVRVRDDKQPKDID